MERVDAITISTAEFYKSSEIVLHVKKEYDYRYVVPELRNIVVNMIRRCINRQVKLGLRKEQCVIYKVPRGSLKSYQTQKTEAAIGIERRPEKKYIVLHDVLFLGTTLNWH